MEQRSFETGYVEPQEGLDLSGLKREIMKAMPWDSQATNLFAALSPQEIFDLVPPTKVANQGDFGLLFENVARKILLKESSNPDIEEVQRLLSDFFRRQLNVHLGVGSVPDFLEINDQFEIKKVFECKASKNNLK